MALAFSVFAAPDPHIAYLQRHPGLVHSYLEGSRPDPAPLSPLVDGWPEQMPTSMGSWGVNHRNTQLYHWILNGGPELVQGSGSLFQVWHAPKALGAAVCLDLHDEHFALDSSRIDELAQLVARVNGASVKQAFTAWCKSKGDDYQPDDLACLSFVDEFEAFARGLEDAGRKGFGIIW